MIGYCVRCKRKREMSSVTQTRMKNNRKAFKGRCSVCSTKMYRIGGK